MAKDDGEEDVHVLSIDILEVRFDRNYIVVEGIEVFAFHFVLNREHSLRANI